MRAGGVHIQPMECQISALYEACGSAFRDSASIAGNTWRVLCRKENKA